MIKSLLILLLILMAQPLPFFKNIFKKRQNKEVVQTVANTNFLVFPEDIGRYINQVRLRPSILIPIIQDKLSRFIDGKRIMTGSTIHQTFEGKVVWQEALNFINQLQPMGPLNFSVVLQRAAIDHAIDLAMHNAISHVGSKGQSIYQRVSKYASFESGTISQTVVSQYQDQTRDHALETILSLIVSDGLLTRHYRKTLFNPAIRFYGQASRMGNKRSIVVILFSTNTYQLVLKSTPRKKTKSQIQPMRDITRTKGSSFIANPLLSNTPNSRVSIAAVKNVVQVRVKSTKIIGGSQQKIMQRVFADGSQQTQTQVTNLSNL